MTSLAMHPQTTRVLSVTHLGIQSSVSAESIKDLIPHLKELSLGKSNENVECILKALLSPNTEDSILITWLKQLKDNIYSLGKNNARVTSILLRMQWVTRSHEVSLRYHELIVNLVSAHPSYMQPVLLMIIKTFTYGDDKTSYKSNAYKKAHALLQDIFLLVPVSQPLMAQLLGEKFPYLKHQRHLILSYCLNVLNVCCYLPAYRLTILQNLLDKVLQVDLQCTRDIITEFEEEKKKEAYCVMDIDSVVSESMAFPMADTLDLLMDGLFVYIECTCFNKDSGELDWEATKKLYRELLTIFDKLVLPSPHCSHIQFLMFYICSLNPALCDGFLQYLWKKVNDPMIAPTRRQFAAFYIGSFLSRASYVGVQNIIACYDIMGPWVNSYIDNYDGLSSCEIGSHGTFYSVCQALFYVFAFRHKDFINLKNGFKYLRNVNFERIVSCRLNPLKFCQPIIVQNFASVARNYQIAYCYPIIERNSRNLCTNSVNNNSSLVSFFPFDPYLLKRSKKWIEPLYRLYDSQNEDESMERDEEDLRMQPVNEDLFSYSRSPGFKELYYLQPQRL